MARQLSKPTHLKFDFKPSARQYEVWRSVQPECHICGAKIHYVTSGFDKNGNEEYKPVCTGCGNENIPRIILSGGAAGGGKSWLGCMWLLSSCIRWEGFKCVIARLTLKVLKETTGATLLNCIKNMKLKENVHYTYDKVNGIYEFWNGSQIILKELAPSPSDPTYSALGGLEISAAFIDEVDQIEEKAVDVLYSRIRWKIKETLVVPKLLLSCNPNLTWVRTRFVLDENNDEVVCRKSEMYIPFSVYDNPNKEFRDTYVASLDSLPEKERQRLLFGNWNFVESNIAACYKSFTDTKHMVNGLFEEKFSTSRPVILSFDFNTYPYMSTLLIQINYTDKEIYFLRELLGYAKDKRNNTPDHTAHISKFLEDNGFESTVIITGDPAGKQKSTLVKEGVNNFTLIEDGLMGFYTKTKVLSKQPSQSLRVEFINEIMKSEFDGWKVLVDTKCVKFIEDLLFQLQNDDGTKQKKKVLDPKSGIKYEKFGHLNDCMELALCTLLSDSWAKFKNKKHINNPVIATTKVQPLYSY